MDSLQRINELKSLLQRRILIIDGAMGTQIQAKGLGPEDFGGDDYEGCNEYLNITRPDVIADIHRAYLEAGADILETNTFGATSLVLGEYDLAEHARRVNHDGAEIARRVADEITEREPDKPRFVAGAMGPTTRTISVTGGMTFDELAEDYHQQAAGLIEGGSDVLLLETSQDTINIKAVWKASIGRRPSWVPTYRLPSREPSNPWAPCWPARMRKLCTRRWRIGICFGWDSTVPPVPNS